LARSTESLRWGAQRTVARKLRVLRRSFSSLTLTSLAIVAAHCTTYSGIQLPDQPPEAGGTGITAGSGGTNVSGSGGSGNGGAGGNGSTPGSGGSGGATGGTAGRGGVGGSAGLADASVTGGSSGSGGSTGGSGAAGSNGASGGGSGGAAGSNGTGGTSGTAGTAGSAGSGGAAGSTGSGGTSGTAGGAGSGATGGAAGTGGAGGSSGTSGGAGKGGAAGAAGSAGATDAGPATCTSYVPDSTYPCAMGIPPNCGTNPVNCGATICPANSSCGGGNVCVCITGYLSVACGSGLHCSTSVSCTGGQWGCLPKPDPGCTGNPSTTQGVCSCSDGKTYNLMCGGTTTCDQHCRQGS
jgi:hypothetical protein